MTTALPPFRARVGRDVPSPAAAWVLRHRAQLALAAGVAAVVGVLAFFILLNRGELAERAADQLAVARGQAAARRPKEALQTLDALLRTSRSSPAAMQAYVMKGELLLTEGKTQDAEAVYAAALAQAAEPAYRALFMAGSAHCAMELRKWGEAEKLWRSFLQSNPEHFLAPRVHMDLGRALIAQEKWADAQAALEKLATLYPKSIWFEEAQAYLADVRSRLPAAPERPAAP